MKKAKRLLSERKSRDGKAAVPDEKTAVLEGKR